MVSEVVECLSSASYPGEPIALTWDGQRRLISAVLGRWRTPDGIGFRVRTSEGLVFDLIYDTADCWHIEPSPGGQAAASPDRNP